MPRTPATSRTRYRRYKQHLVERRSAGEFRIASSWHETGPPRKPPSRSFFVLLGEFWRLLRDQRGAIVFALTTLTFATALALVPPAATKWAIDYVFTGLPVPESITRYVPIPTDRHQLLLLIACSLVLMSLVAAALHISGRWQATRATKLMQSDLRRRVFEHAVRLPLHRVYALKSGGVASILREDAGAVAELVFGMMYNPWRAIIQLLGSFVVLALTDWRLLLGSILLLPTVWITHRTWINRVRPLFRDIRVQRQEIDGQSTEAFGGMRVVRAFSRERSESGRFTRGNHLMARQELAVWWWSRIIELAWAVLIPVASAVLLWYGGTRVIDGKLTIGDLILFLTYLVMLLGPLEALASSATQFQSSLAALDRILDMLHEPRELPDRPGATVLDRVTVRGAIGFHDVTFAYLGGTPVLHEITINAAAGSMVALVGPSGAGKTTLCNLVARFHDPTAGSITLDGTDVRDIRLESYRSLLGVVEQDVFLFDGSIADNIAYAERGADMARIRAAADAANATEFIDALPAGFETAIGERGVRLSGGQRQRLAIARALLADPRILILDEATSNLDSESERLIQRSLAELMRNRTSFVIAHRLSTIAHADLILVIEHGRVVESGTHDELLARSGRYQQMVLLQTADFGTRKVAAGV